MPAVNLSKKTWLATRVRKADTFVTRLLGFLTRWRLEPEEALWIAPCKGVHTFGMKFPIDVIFLDGDRVVIDKVEALGPWRITPVHWQCRSVLELGAGSIGKSRTEIGDHIDISMVEDWAPDPVLEGGMRVK